MRDQLYTREKKGCRVERAENNMFQEEITGGKRKEW